ncbi:exonuclease SbcCD subunit D [Larsenimonas rhizosphaerae]|uniref:Nuclease SbcCD subunit D n=1 Tax=Larsenimonas rhizosphaerae TaxID=2944682 RepID=A0AA41ZCY0_9GAMM|nr:exonuclease SbcCD subunit D [Larsenimonas rhizosphaerae]MCX2522999.1 exonuclease SbcCD subunit D C-terminal domain-containing protein [Larsenimonas rhizosphaerae]
MLTFLHTADWHLGQNFHGHDRHAEHRAFLDWLLDTLNREAIDALLIAGDIFDVVNPSLAAQRLLYDFILKAHTARPAMDIVMIAGNHDSGARIELPGPLLERLNTHAIGQLHYLDGAIDTDRLCVPLTDAAGRQAAWCVAIPFLRPSDVSGRGYSDYQAGARAVHDDIFARALARRAPDEALIAMGHAHLKGGSISEHSERPIVIGGEESLPASLFPEDIAYVAMGHLHKPQRVDHQDRIRYSGSPIPLDLSERHYARQVCIGKLDQGHLVHQRSIAIPDHTPMRRIGPASLPEVLAELDALEQDTAASPGWLDVQVMLEGPCLSLRADIDARLTGKPWRLVAIQVHYPRSDKQAPPSPRLEDTTPAALFEATWTHHYGSAPDATVLADFHALAQAVHDSEDPA